MKYKLKVYTIYEMGQRENQEDWIYPATGKESEEDRLFVLCDGMGGHQAGEVASKTVCEAISQYVLNNYEAEGPFTDEDMQKAVDAAFDALDNLETEDTPQKQKMGTTMTCLKLHDKGYTIAHIGDSRVYHIRPNNDDDADILYVTRDHSLVNDLIAIGELTEEEAKLSKQKNVITRAMQPGMERRPAPDVHSSDIESGDFFYLCSDGMLEEMDDTNIKYLFHLFRTNEKKLAKKLIKHTENNQDNHSAIIIHVLKVMPDQDGEEETSLTKALVLRFKKFLNESLTRCGGGRTSRADRPCDRGGNAVT